MARRANLLMAALAATLCSQMLSLRVNAAERAGKAPPAGNLADRDDQKAGGTPPAAKLADQDDLIVRQGGKGKHIHADDVKVVVTGTLTGSDFLKLMQHATGPIGITGNQSFIEAVYLKKTPWYETMAWKHGFYQGFINGISKARDAHYMIAENAQNLTEFMDLVPREPDVREVDGWISNRTVRIRDIKKAITAANLYIGKSSSLQKAVQGMEHWLTEHKNFRTWIVTQLTQKLKWHEILSRRSKEPKVKVFRVLLFMENMIGWGNTILLQRIESVINSITIEVGGVTCKPLVRCVVTTMMPLPGAEATPEKIKERKPEWIVPAGDVETQLQSLIATAEEFKPDIAMAAPATSYDYDVRPDLYQKLQLEPSRPVLWLGEYDCGEKEEESELSNPIFPLGLGENSSGILVPSDIKEKLESPWDNHIAKTLATDRNINKEGLLFFAYLQSEEALRDYLLLATVLANKYRRKAIVVMPRMKCWPKNTAEGNAHEFRNMQAMLQQLIHPEGPFGGTLAVIRAEPGENIFQWDADTEKCELVAKAELPGPQIGVNSVFELIKALGTTKPHTHPP